MVSHTPLPSADVMLTYLNAIPADLYIHIYMYIYILTVFKAKCANGCVASVSCDYDESV